VICGNGTVAVVIIAETDVAGDGDGRWEELEGSGEE
jgi:hypothetical protein